MYKQHTVGVVVPAYNEEGLVGDVLETMPAIVDRVYVFDDCSSDGTWAEIRSAAERVNAVDADHGAGAAHDVEADDSAGTDHDVDADRSRASVPADDRLSDGGTVNDFRDAPASDGAEGSEQNSAAVSAVSSTGDPPGTDSEVAFERRICPIQHERNRGVGGAIKTGYQRALDDGVDVVAVMGGDGQMRPEELPSYLDPIVDDEVDYTKGIRLLSRELREEMSSWRLLGNWILTVLTKIASGYWRTMDPQNGYTAISREALEATDGDLAAAIARLE